MGIEFLAISTNEYALKSEYIWSIRFLKKIKEIRMPISTGQDWYQRRAEKIEIRKMPPVEGHTIWLVGPRSGVHPDHIVSMS